MTDLVHIETIEARMNAPSKVAEPLWHGGEEPWTQWLGSQRRPMGREDIHRIFTRDREGLVDQLTLERFTDAVLSLDDSMPNGSYVDMCTKLPSVGPVAIQVPTLILRGELDGIASDADVAAFFERLSHVDKQF